MVRSGPTLEENAGKQESKKALSQEETKAAFFSGLPPASSSLTKCAPPPVHMVGGGEINQSLLVRLRRQQGPEAWAGHVKLGIQSLS